MLNCILLLARIPFRKIQKEEKVRVQRRLKPPLTNQCVKLAALTALTALSKAKLLKTIRKCSVLKEVQLSSSKKNAKKI